MKTLLVVCSLLSALGAVVRPAPAAAQGGVTTASMTGTIRREGGSVVGGVRIVAVHEPSGTTYRAVSRTDGRFTIPGMRVGGPYSVTATGIGLAPQRRDRELLTLGVATDVSFVLSTAVVQLAAVTVTGQSGTISSTRTGAATAVSREAIEALPTISRTIGDFTRLTPQASGSSFAGQDSRMNNLSVDGSYFNNGFGLSDQPGGRTRVAPIPLDAIEQIQVNVAPYDVRQGNFVGAGVNAVTKSGTNAFSGSLYYLGRDEGFVGKEARGQKFDGGSFNFTQVGARLGGPIIRNRLFFFANFEDDGLDAPATTFRANTGTQTVEGNTTRVRESDLTALQGFLSENFGYETGAFTGYKNETPSRRYIGKLDFNANDRNKLSLRYIQLDSRTDNLISNSNSLGFGGRRTNLNSLSFANSSYGLLENIRSLVGEWNAQVGANMSNNFIAGITSNDESRVSKGSVFPLVDILEGGRTYTLFGFEPFTPNNELRYKTLQLQNNFTIFTDRHDLTFGATAQRFDSENSFNAGSQSVYVYNSLEDFYTDARGYLANPARTTSPVTLRRFQVRYNNIPGVDKPVQPLDVVYGGAYAQDEWRATDELRLTLGLRFDVPRFANTGFANAQVDSLTFRDEDGRAVRYSTSRLPDANVLFSPRLGLNWDVRGDRSTQVRGGTGIFTGSPPFVWVSNQIGANGVLTGFEQLENTRARPFSPDPATYKPREVTGAPAAQYELAFSDPGYRFPQLWRSNLAVDQRLPFGFVGTAELLYSRDVNGTYYINADLASPDTAFTGADGRPRWSTPARNRINPKINNATVLKNQSVGTSWIAAATLERAFTNGFFAKGAYSYGEARNTVNPGSIASGSWFRNPHAGDPNNPGLGYSESSPGHRAFVALSYRRQYFGFGATSVSLFSEGITQGNASYTYSGDLNGDGGFGNDLLYIPRNISEMNFETYTTGTGTAARTYTATEQAAAFEAFIQQDDYLRANRGRYAERGAIFLPMAFRTDLSLTQDLFTSIGGKKNSVQVRLDILNVGNLLNDRWGVGHRLVTTQPLVARGADATGAARYRLQTINGAPIAKTYERSAGITDVYRMQLGLRYVFN